MYLPKLFLHLLVSPMLAGALLTILSLDLSAYAQTTVAPATTPEKRIKPTFFEEERRIRTPTPAEEREDKAERASTGFDTTFLSDALSGNQDPGAMVGRNPGVEDNSHAPAFLRVLSIRKAQECLVQVSLVVFGIFQTAP
ncbi:MAG: hypothetical protein HC856_03640 [Pseudanabaena sp. RU_4_16]|nr:hypothetical protein [Pseudanabaena sp. RU_4_16]